MSSGVCFDIFQKALDSYIGIIEWDRHLVFVPACVEVSSDGKGGERAIIVFVMGCVLRSVDFEKAVVFVGIHSGTRHVDINLLPHVTGVCRNELGEGI